jgi:trimeric autotransporter adhesin
LYANTASDNSAFGSGVTAVAGGALVSNTTGTRNAAFGGGAGASNTTGNYNTALGTLALKSNTTASNNTAVGYQALYTNTTGNDNVVIGYQAGYNNTEGIGVTAIGRDAGYSNINSSYGTYIGNQAGLNATGTLNTFVGWASGYLVSSGIKNTIIGSYSGNQGGLDIRTLSNNIVLSDGDGNLGFYIYQNSNTHVPLVYDDTTASGANVHIATGGRLYRSTSSLRYKNTVNDATHGLTELLALRPVTYKGNNDGDTVFGGLIAEEVHDAGLTEFVQYNDDGEPDALAYSNMVSLCIKAIQEQQATITALTARITALES